MTYISQSSDFSSFIFCAAKHFTFIGKAQFRQATLSCDSSYTVMETTYADSWLDMTQPCDMDLWVMK